MRLHWRNTYTFYTLLIRSFDALGTTCFARGGRDLTVPLYHLSMHLAYNSNGIVRRVTRLHQAFRSQAPRC